MTGILRRVSRWRRPASSDAAPSAKGGAAPAIHDGVLTLPGRASGTPAYARGGQARWNPVEPAGSVRRTPPVRHGSLPSALLDDVVPGFPDLGVVELQDGIVAGAYGWIVTSDGTLLPDHSWHGDEMPRRRYYQRRMGLDHTLQHLPGTALTLATFRGWENYGHFLLDGAARLHLAEAAGFGPAAVDHVIYCAPHAGARRILERLGIPMDRAIEARPGVALQVDRLIAPSFPGLKRNYPRWVATYLHDRLTPDDVEPHRRLYVPRLRERRILNADELMPHLEAHGFEVFDPGAHADPIRVFAEARIVVGGHGAGLADLALCAPGTVVLELLPSEHQRAYYYTLADGAGLDYGYLVGASRPGETPPGTPANRVDFRIDVDEFRAALDWAVERDARSGP